MIKHFKAFFHPPVLTYSYNQPKDLVVAKITEVLKNKATLFSSNDTQGNFLNADTFVINAVSAVNTRGVKYSSALVGKIIESQEGITEIKTKAKPSFTLYSLFFVTIVFGLIYLYKFIQTGSSQASLWVHYLPGSLLKLLSCRNCIGCMLCGVSRFYWGGWLLFR